MKKRSKYKPKPIRVDTMSFVKSGMLKVAHVPDAGIKLQLRNYESLDEILTGNPTKEHVDDLIATVNMAEALAFLFDYGSDWMPEIKQAQDAVYAMAQRGISGKSFRFTGEELNMVRVVLELHDEQLKVTSVKQMEEALDYIGKIYKHRRAREIKPLEKSNA